MSDFGKLMKEVRKQLDLSQEELARQLGVSFASINRWENGRTKPLNIARMQFEAFCEKMVDEGKLNLRKIKLSK